MAAAWKQGQAAVAVRACATATIGAPGAREARLMEFVDRIGAKRGT